MSDEKKDLPEVDMPESMSLKGQSAVALHEMFLSYRKAGFSEDQALKLIACIIVFGQTPPDTPE
jgi:hypothetical protein